MATVYLRVGDLASFESNAADALDIEVHLLADGAPVDAPDARIPIVIAAEIAVPSSLEQMEKDGVIRLVSLDESALAEIRMRFGC